MMMINCFCGIVDQRRLTLFPAGTIVRDHHHRESPTRRKQDFNLCRILAQTLLNEVVLNTTPDVHNDAKKILTKYFFGKNLK